MNPGCQAEILALLRRHRGPGNAITAEAIGELLFGRKGLARQVRAAIAELIEDGHGEIIANTGGGEAFQGYPAGYFWAATPEQAEAYYQVLVSRHEELHHRMESAWRAKLRLEHQEPEQLPLDIGEGPRLVVAGQRPALPGTLTEARR